MTIEVEFGDFNDGPYGDPMTKTDRDMFELLAEHDQGDFLLGIAEAVLQLIMETDVEGIR